MNRTAIVLSALIICAAMAGCSEDEPGGWTTSTPRTPAPGQGLDEQEPDTGEPPTTAPALAHGSQVKPRTQENRPGKPEGFGDWVAAPLVYTRTAIRMRGYASDKIKEATATRALKMFEALEGRKPESVKELNDWLVEQGSTPLAQPDKGGLYAYDPSTKKVVIINPPE